MTEPQQTGLVEQSAGRDTEADAWSWLERTFGTENDDPVDRAYAADEMVDAFHAGRTRADPPELAAQRALVAELETALLSMERILQATPERSDFADDLAQQQDEALCQLHEVSQAALKALRDKATLARAQEQAK